MKHRADDLLDGGDRGGASGRTGRRSQRRVGMRVLVEYAADELDGGLAARDRAEGDDANERSLEPPEVGGDPRGDLAQRIGGGSIALVCISEELEQGDARRQVGRRELDPKPPLEPIAESLGEAGERLWGPIAGQNELPAGLVEGIEGVEELLLGVRLVLEELN